MFSSDPSKSPTPETLDEFWNIEKLLPHPSKPTPTPPPRSPKQIETTEIVFGEETAGGTQVSIALPLQSPGTAPATPPAKPEPPTPELCYRPPHPLIREVRIYPWRSSFRFYERFCAMAEQLHERHGAPCDPVPFFSYMPQYDQMNRAQLSWYLYWRDAVRRGEYLPTDYSYIFLYLFEIINLPDRIPPREGQALLCRLWKRYRGEYPLLNRYLSDWICDYSLIHRLPPPKDSLSDTLSIIAEQSSFKEFYAVTGGDDANRDAEIYLTFCTNYDYHKSKLYLAGAEQAAAMDRHIPAAISCALSAMSRDHLAFAGTKMQQATLCRDTFVGALCSGRMKRRIEVDYCSFQRSHELRFFITDIIKYTENRLRQVFGIKSRLSIYGLSEEMKKVLNDYYAAAFPSRRAAGGAEGIRPAYEALYDLPETPLSAENARAIEQSSWGITQQLVEAFEEPLTPTVEPIVPAPMPVEAPPAAPVNEPTPWSPYLAFLQAVLHRSQKDQLAAARVSGKLPDAVAEEINTLAVEQLGDILIEQDENGTYQVISDYLDELTQLLKSTQ